MTVQRLRDYRITCDGQIRRSATWIDDCPSHYRENAIVVQATNPLDASQQARDDHGWKVKSDGGLLCPRSDHIE
jgi:hypothetical protein